jgi:hypothetical protein
VRICYFSLKNLHCFTLGFADRVQVNMSGASDFVTQDTLALDDPFVHRQQILPHPADPGVCDPFRHIVAGQLKHLD